MQSKKTFILVLILLLLLASGAYAYMHHCQQQLREVDRYALAKVVEFMETLETWDYESIKPYLTDRYNDLLTEEEWNLEMDRLGVLGDLRSFDRPRHVSHQQYKKYFVCESAIDMYSVASEYEHDNAVVRIFFDNNYRA